MNITGSDAIDAASNAIATERVASPDGATMNAKKKCRAESIDLSNTGVEDSGNGIESPNRANGSRKGNDTCMPSVVPAAANKSNARNNSSVRESVGLGQTETSCTPKDDRYSIIEFSSSDESGLSSTVFKNFALSAEAVVTTESGNSRGFREDDSSIETPNDSLLAQYPPYICSKYRSTKTSRFSLCGRSPLDPSRLAVFSNNAFQTPGSDQNEVANESTGHVTGVSMSPKRIQDEASGENPVWKSLGLISPNPKSNSACSIENSAMPNHKKHLKDMKEKLKTFWALQKQLDLDLKDRVVVVDDDVVKGCSSASKRKRSLKATRTLTPTDSVETCAEARAVCTVVRKAVAPIQHIDGSAFCPKKKKINVKKTPTAADPSHQAKRQTDKQPGKTQSGKQLKNTQQIQPVTSSEISEAPSCSSPNLNASLDSSEAKILRRQLNKQRLRALQSYPEQDDIGKNLVCGNHYYNAYTYRLQFQE